MHESKAHVVIDSLGLFLVGSRERANILQAQWWMQTRSEHYIYSSSWVELRLTRDLLAFTYLAPCAREHMHTNILRAWFLTDRDKEEPCLKRKEEEDDNLASISWRVRTFRRLASRRANNIVHYLLYVHVLATHIRSTYIIVGLPMIYSLWLFFTIFFTSWKIKHTLFWSNICKKILILMIYNKIDRWIFFKK
jgi:hypothetical protein